MTEEIRLAASTSAICSLISSAKVSWNVTDIQTVYFKQHNFVLWHTRTFLFKLIVTVSNLTLQRGFALLLFAHCCLLIYLQITLAYIVQFFVVLNSIHPATTVPSGGIQSLASEWSHSLRILKFSIYQLQLCQRNSEEKLMQWNCCSPQLLNFCSRGFNNLATSNSNTVLIAANSTSLQPDVFINYTITFTNSNWMIADLH